MTGGFEPAGSRESAGGSTRNGSPQVPLDMFKLSDSPAAAAAFGISSLATASSIFRELRLLLLSLERALRIGAKILGGAMEEGFGATGGAGASDWKTAHGACEAATGLFRRGWLLGDGTDTGKDHQVAGILLDDWLKGRRRGVWITMPDKRIENAQRDSPALGMERLLVTPLSRFRQRTPIRLDEGILFTTYPTLYTEERGERLSRVRQIAQWLGADFDGAIVFDESHVMQNAVGGKGEHDDQASSQQGRAGLWLLHVLPKARVVAYVSVTGATTVHNLAYAQCLGQWGGADFPFATRAEFVEAMEQGGVVVMEVLARDLKPLGLYVARLLSYEVVEYELVEHSRTPEQIRIYDTCAGAFGNISNNLDAAMQAANNAGDTGTLYAQAKFVARSAFTDSTIHIAPGLPLPIWKQLPSEPTRVSRLQTDAGERCIGSMVSPAWLIGTLAADVPAITADAMIAALMDRRIVFELAGGFQLRRVRVMGANRIELSELNDAMRGCLKACRFFHENISWKLRMFIPADTTAHGILARTPEGYPLEREAA